MRKKTMPSVSYESLIRYASKSGIHKTGRHGAVGFVTAKGMICAECNKPIYNKSEEMDWEGGLKEMIENNLWGLVCDKCTGGGWDYDEKDKCEQCNGNGIYDWKVEPLVGEVKKIINQAVAQERERAYKNVGSWYKLPEYKEMTMSKNIDGSGEIVKAGCSVCGGKPVTIRGKYPHTPNREICPTCTREVLEGIYDGCNNRQAFTDIITNNHE